MRPDAILVTRNGIPLNGKPTWFILCPCCPLDPRGAQLPDVQNGVNCIIGFTSYPFQTVSSHLDLHKVKGAEPQWVPKDA